MHCELYYENIGYQFSEENIQAIAEALQTIEPIPYQNLSIAFLAEKHICEIHQQFLNDPKPTDVITFPTDPEEGIGEICISIEEAIKRSPQFQQTLEQELLLYLVHGWLHLSHYDDIEPHDRELMRQAEQRLLTALAKQGLTLQVKKSNN